MMPPNPTALPADPGQGSHYWSRRQRKGSMGRTAVPSAPPVRDLGQAAEDRITVEAPARPSSGWVALNYILGAYGILGAMEIAGRLFSERAGCAVPIHAFRSARCAAAGCNSRRSAWSRRGIGLA